MFERGELEFLFVCVDGRASTDLRSGKIKAHLLYKISDLLEAEDKQEPANKTPEPDPEADTKKK